MIADRSGKEGEFLKQWNPGRQLNQTHLPEVIPKDSITRGWAPVIYYLERSSFEISFETSRVSMVGTPSLAVQLLMLLTSSPNE